MKIPYGIHDYKTIIDKKYLFVDKTRYIPLIEELGEYIVFLRPRRFGKTLFTSMLYYYYDINNKENFDYLFNDTYISNNITSEANSYYVLKFDFSGINSDKTVIERNFSDCVCDYLQSFINDYKLDIEIDNNKEVNTILRGFLIRFKSLTNKQIYLIIDEYDHFANNVLTTDLDFFNEITGKDGFVRSFYEVFKTYAGTIIGRMFITGVTPITLDSLTSGFNVAKNVSKHVMLNEMMGFTKDEVIHVLKELDIDAKHLSILRDNYNGYLFNDEADTKVYNSNMTLYYLDNMVICKKPPRNLTDPNIISDYTKMTSMFDLYKDDEDKKEIIHSILNNETVSTTITDKFNLKLEFDKDHFLSMLYYLGLLTIVSGYGSEIGLRTPNYIIKNIYFQYYYYYLNKELDIKLDIRHIKDAVRELSMNNHVNQFVNLLEKFLSEISNRDFIKFDEKYIKLLMITYLRLSDLYLVKSEYEVNGEYIDIALLPNNLYGLNNYFIFELKYISKAKYSESLLGDMRREAVEQINKYADNEEMRRIKNLRKYVFVFVHDECKVMELIP